MIGTWMLYAVAVTVALSGAALAADRALQLLELPQRWVWLGALVASLVLPIALPVVFTRGGDVPAVEFDYVSAVAQPAMATAPRAEPEDGPRWLEGLERVLTWGWAGASLMGFLALGGSALTLARLRRRWRRARVSGEAVLISSDTGPAVVGCLRNEIVLPAWVLDCPLSQQEMIVAHEREHARARDPLLMLTGWIALALAPWNPPLWWLVRRQRLAVEVDCDRRVLRRIPDTYGYGVLLVEVGRRSSGRWLTATAFSEPASFLERRIRIMTRRRTRSRWMPIAMLLLVASALPPVLDALPAQSSPILATGGAWLGAIPGGPEIRRSGGASVGATRAVGSRDTLPVGIREPILRDTTPDRVLQEAAIAREEAIVREREARVRQEEERVKVVREESLARQETAARRQEAILREQEGRVQQEEKRVGAVRAESLVRQEAVARRQEAQRRAAARSDAQNDLASDRPARLIGVPTSSGAQADSAYEVAVLERKPELINKSEVASLMQRLYPRGHWDAGVAGTVTMQFVIGAGGVVEPRSVKVVDASHAEFADASVKALEKFRFRPGQYRGRNVRVIIQMPIAWQPVRTVTLEGVAADRLQASDAMRIRGSTSAAPPALGGRIAGIVVDATSGQPIAGATVVVPALTRGAVTSSEGRFLLFGVPAGMHIVEVLAPGATDREVQRAQLTANQTVSLRFEIPTR